MHKFDLFFDAFRYPNPRKVDLLNTLKITEISKSHFLEKYENHPKMGGRISCLFACFLTLFLTWGPHGVPGPLQTHPEVVFKWFGYRFWAFFVAFKPPPQKKEHGGGTARLRTG